MDIPKYYFRTRDNGAFVFRVESEGPSARLEMQQIASINLRKHEVRTQGDTELTDADRAAIEDWMAARADVLALRKSSEIAHLTEALHTLTQWAQAEATAEELDAVTADLLLAMHDLRSTLVRKLAERARGGG